MARRNFIRINKIELPLIQTGGWQIIYTGFVLIMLCFFILLTSFASLQQSKVTRFAKSFSDAVNVFNAGRSLERGATMIDSDAMVVDRQDQVAQLFETVTRLGQQNGLEKMNLRRSKRGVILTLADNLLFESGDAVISKAAHDLLNKIGRVVNTIGSQIEIEGHTDDMPISTADYPSNWELSTARAVNVLRYLISQCHVKSQRLSAVGLSEYHPLVPNQNSENRAKNRRVDIIFRPEWLK